MAGFPESEDPFGKWEIISADSPKLFQGPNPLDVAQFDQTAQHVFALYDSYRRAGFTDDQAFELVQGVVSALPFAS